MTTGIASSRHIAIPRGEEMDGGKATLLFPRGAEDLHLGAGDTEHLATGVVSGRSPDVMLAGRALSVGFRRDVGRTDSELRLNPDLVWSIGTESGVKRWTADLVGLRIEGIRIGGGANRLRLYLPRPTDRVRIEIEGGADRVEIRRPTDTRTVLQISGGASFLTVDDQQYVSISGEVRLESMGDTETAGEYQIAFRRGIGRASVIPTSGS